MELFNVPCARDSANFEVLMSDTFISRAHGVVVSHPLRMRKALGSNPSVSMHLICQVSRSSLRLLSLPKSMHANTHRALPDVTWNSSTCRAHETLLNFSLLFSDTLISRAHGVVVSHPLRMRKALGSNPSVSMHLIFQVRRSAFWLLSALKTTTHAC